MIKFDLGGVGKGTNGYKTVNLAVDADIKEDIINLDLFCEDNSVDEFYMSHTLEHISIIHYKKFILDLKRKLKIGGIIKIIQTDVGEVLKMLENKKLLFRSARACIFPPANRCINNMLLQHQNMWSANELARDFEYIDMKTEIFDAGSWSFDVEDDIYTSETIVDFGKRIPNIGVKAIKQDNL